MIHEGGKDLKLLQDLVSASDLDTAVLAAV